MCYVVYVDAIEPIEGKDRVECARVGGWTCMVPKGSMQVGEPAIYFEIDSKLPEVEPFMFLAKKHFKIKTQKFKAGEGHFFSQGLLMAASDFGWTIERTEYVVGEGSVNCIIDNNGVQHIPGEESAFLTKQLGVTYAEAEDNKRKSNGIDKYKRMAGMHPTLFQNPIIKAIYKTNWGKKFLFIFFGKGTKKTEWPDWVVKTDEERIQNLTHMISEFTKEKWYATEKIDGTSTTFTLKRGKRKKLDYRVCSRNVVMNNPNRKSKCYYDETAGNVYLEMAEKYNMREVLESLLIDDFAGATFVTIQGETYGNHIQKRDYSLEGHDLAVFNVIIGNPDGTTIRLNPADGKAIMAKYGIPYVPILGVDIIELPDTCEGILAIAGGKSEIDGKPREGIVFRSVDGKRSFKAVDNEFLAKYHG